MAGTPKAEAKTHTQMFTTWGQNNTMVRILFTHRLRLNNRYGEVTQPDAGGRVSNDKKEYCTLNGPTLAL